MPLSEEEKAKIIEEELLRRNQKTTGEKAETIFASIGFVLVIAFFVSMMYLSFS